VEIFVKKGATVRYTTIQNWSKNVYNLNTKRALVEEDGKVEWVGGSLGSKATMLYPMSALIGRGASARHLNIALAGPGQWKDTGAKVIHGAPHTSSRVISKSISLGGGRSTYRGLLKVARGAAGAKAHVQCDALLLDEHSQSDTYPTMEVYEDDVSIMHEATVNRVTDEQLFYLRSRGLTEDQSLDLILSGFLDPISRELPLDYAIELNRFIRMEMTGSVG
jgi:Fe-S cluster assembly protein SufB